MCNLLAQISDRRKAYAKNSNLQDDVIMCQMGNTVSNEHTQSNHFKYHLYLSLMTNVLLAIPFSLDYFYNKTDNVATVSTFGAKLSDSP